MELGYVKEVVNKNFLVSFYKDLKLENMKIESIDEEFLQFTNLKTLSVSRNKISVLQNLPQGLKELYAYYNNIHTLKLNKPFTELLFLGLAYNKLNDSFVGKPLYLLYKI